MQLLNYKIAQDNLDQFNLHVLLLSGKKMVTIENFLPNFFWGVKMRDKLAISAYIS